MFDRKYLESDQVKGAFFLAGGVALFLFTFDVLTFLSRIVLILFSLVLVVYGLMKGHFIEKLRARLDNKNQSASSGDSNLYTHDKDELKAAVYLVAGGLLFLYAAGILTGLIKLLLIVASIFCIVFGLKKTHILKILTAKAKEQERRNEQEEKKHHHSTTNYNEKRDKDSSQQ